MSNPHEDLIAELRAASVDASKRSGVLLNRAAQALSALQARVGEETAKRVEAERAFQAAMRAFATWGANDGRKPTILKGALPMDEVTDRFEAYPVLASWMERLGNTPGVLSLGDWMVFCGAVNHALAQAKNAARNPDRIGTHGPNCHTWGPRHYECALRRIEELEAPAQEPPSPDNLNDGKD